MHEIERKFLLSQPVKRIVTRAEAQGIYLGSVQIAQRYLQGSGDWSIRCRKVIADGVVTCFITMKRKISDLKSIELESQVDPAFYEQMALQCGPTLLKTRHRIRHVGHVWEIDVFHNPEMEGLAIAEVELASEDERLALPIWVGKEVTSKKRYRNARLAQQLAA